MTYKIPRQKEKKENNFVVPAKREWELQTRYDARKSFYGKAVVRSENGRLILRSYNTDVAQIKNGKPEVYGTYSLTTLRHITEFLKQQGFKAETSKQIIKDYGAEKGKVKSEDNSFKSVGMVASLGDVFGKTKKEKNAWKLRMLKAGLGKKGFQVPDDWDKLSENEKEKRLNKVLGVLRE